MQTMVRDNYELTIGEQGVRTNGSMPVFDPSQGTMVAEVPIADAGIVDAAVASAGQAANQWGRLTIDERAAHVVRLADALAADSERLATVDAFDSGNPLTAMRRDLDIGVRALRYFAGIAPELQGATYPASGTGLHLTQRTPYGVVVRLIPFNHPLMFCALHAAAPLMAGNTVILKAPDQTPLAPLEFAAVAAEILPPGVVTVLTGPGPITGDALVRDLRVRRIGFTGRRQTGLSIMKAGAESDVVKHITLELGGKNPLIVFPDVDPREAAAAAVKGMNLEISQGQSCGSTSRVFLHSSVAQQVVEHIHERLEDFQVGDPLDEAVDMGPLVSIAQLTRVRGLVEAGTAAGANVVCGGTAPDDLRDSGGYYLAPTLLDDVEATNVLANEEVFGPVMAVRTWDDREDMLREVNSSRYGLTTNVLTHRLEWALETARQVEAGTVWVNGGGQHFLTVPFGGWKDSGLGCEGSIEALESFTRTKAIHILGLDGESRSVADHINSELEAS